MMPEATDLPPMQGTDIPIELMEQYSPDMAGQMTSLGLWLRNRFDEVATQRTVQEDIWLRDLRQFKGRYEDTEWTKLKEDNRRSKLFCRITRRKVQAFNSRMMDMLFPAGKEKNWSLKHTPEPDVGMTPVAQQMVQTRQQELWQEQVNGIAQESGQPPEDVAQKMEQGGYPVESVELSPDDLRHINLAVARASCERMCSTVADQMAEVKYKIICKKILNSGHIYGTGIFKGPLAQKKHRPQWVFQQGQWQTIMQPVLLPYIEFVSVWSWYPDPTAKEIEDLGFSYQRHVMLKSQVADLLKRPGFDEQVIRSYLTEFPDGDCTQMNWETQLDDEHDGNETTEGRTTKRYEVLEYWGLLDDAQLRDLGLESDPLESIWVNIWVIGHFVIRMGAAPIEGVDHPYSLYYFDKDESSLWGEGVPSIMRDDQSALNATIRAMMDNMASCVGPQYEVNTDVLHPGEKSRETFPNRIWYRRGDGRYPALRSIEVASRLQEFLTLKNNFENQIHENTLPSYMQGGQTGGAGRTASGLSMLMGSANLDVQDQITNFDLGITRPVIRAFYLWNMQFNPDPHIKGDYEVIARGSSSLMAKEIKSQNIDQLLPILSNPQYARFIDERKLLEEIFKVRDLTDTEIMLSEAEFDDREDMRQQIEQLSQQLQQGTDLLQQLWKTAPNLVRQAMDRMGPRKNA